MITLGPFETIEQAVNGAITLLRAEGYVVSVATDDFIPLAEYRAHFRYRHPSGFCRLLAQADCPEFRALRGDSGRIIKIEPNPALTAWLKSRIKP